MSKDAPLNNNSKFRNMSDKLDKALGISYDNQRDSKIRGTAHAAYHGYQCFKTDNHRECERAKDQWNTAWGGRTDHLEKYDKEHNYKEEK